MEKRGEERGEEGRRCEGRGRRCEGRERRRGERKKRRGRRGGEGGREEGRTLILFSSKLDYVRNITDVNYISVDYTHSSRLKGMPTFGWQMKGLIER
jgi:hypothetical protein